METAATAPPVHALRNVGSATSSNYSTCVFERPSAAEARQARGRVSSTRGVPMTENSKNEWPERPESWPAVLTETEVCQYLRLDGYLTVGSAKRSLRYIRKNQGLPDAGRIGRHLLFRLAAVEQWLESREKSGSKIGSDLSLSGPTPDGSVDDA